MHPGMMNWWKHGQGGHGHGHGHHGGGGGGWEGGAEDGDLGVRRPLRFLAYKLELGEQQVAQLATILNELKTERAQVAVDNRRTTAAFADAVAADGIDEAAVKGVADARVKSAERLRDAVAKALTRIHAVLDPQQRQRLAYLIRTGALSI